MNSDLTVAASTGGSENVRGVAGFDRAVTNRRLPKVLPATFPTPSSVRAGGLGQWRDFSLSAWLIHHRFPRDIPNKVYPWGPAPALFGWGIMFAVRFVGRDVEIGPPTPAKRLGPRRRYLAELMRTQRLLGGALAGKSPAHRLFAPAEQRHRFHAEEALMSRLFLNRVLAPAGGSGFVFRPVWGRARRVRARCKNAGLAETLGARGRISSHTTSSARPATSHDPARISRSHSSFPVRREAVTAAAALLAPVQ